LDQCVTADLPSTKAARVADTVRAMIHDGRLLAGDALPSTRALAVELGVARGTVVTAFEQLNGEGYIETHHGAASRVAVSLVGERERAGAGASRVERSHGAAESPPAPVSLVPGLPRISAISVKEWRSAWRWAASRPLLDVFPERNGEEPLRTQIAAQLGFSRGFAPAIRDVIVTSGTSESVSLIVEALGAGCAVAVENPGYRSGQKAAISAGARLVPIGVDDGGMILDELFARHRRSGLDAVMVTPSHQYPLGGVMPLAARQRLLEWAAAEHVLVVEDDYDSEFRHTGAPLPALAAIDSTGAVAHIGSLSKMLDPQLRVGYLVTPPHGAMAERMRAVRDARGAAVAVPVQDAVTRLLATGAVRRHIARMRRDYTHKRELVQRMLSAIPGVRVGALGGGLHADVTWDAAPGGSRDDGDGNGRTVVERLRSRGVEVADLRDYVVPGADAPTEGIVLGYGHVSSTTLAAALDVVVAELAALEESGRREAEIGRRVRRAPGSERPASARGHR
jgi:GntR family transcriptional regulator/MocR family aminotransferase